MESYKTSDMIVGDIIDKNPKLLIGYCHQGVLTHKLRVLLFNTSKLGNTEGHTEYILRLLLRASLEVKASTHNRLWGTVRSLSS